MNIQTQPVSQGKSSAPTQNWGGYLAGAMHQGWLRSILILLLDAVVWFGCYSLLSILRHDLVVSEVNPLTSWLGILPFIAIAITLFMVGGYDHRSNMLSLTYMSEHLLGLMYACALALLLVYCVATFEVVAKPSRGIMLLSFLAFAPLSLVQRRTLYAQALTETAKKYYLVLGVGPIAEDFYRTYLQSPTRQQLRFCDLEQSSAGKLFAGDGSPVIEGNALACLNEVGADVDGVIIAERPDLLESPLLERLIRLHFHRVPVYTLEAFYETVWRKVPVFALDPVWPLQVGFQLARTSPYRHFKRLFDLVVSSVAMIILSPVLLLIALITRLDSGSPVIFRQTRIGRDNLPFTIFKFRTMRQQLPGCEGDLYTKADDSRVTTVGKWLRKLRLDELPQLWNVFKGDMSIIGPRAEWDLLAGQYEKTIPCYHFRHLVKPGISGWAQVNYPYGASREDAIQKLKYDLYYIRHYSLRLDAMIVLKTLHVMLWGKGL